MRFARRRPRRPRRTPSFTVFLLERPGGGWRAEIPGSGVGGEGSTREAALRSLRLRILDDLQVGGWRRAELAEVSSDFLLVRDVLES